MMERRVWVWMLCVLLMVPGCGWAGPGAGRGDAESQPTAAGRVISGEEALRLYGVVEPTAGPAQTATPVFLFPVSVRVKASEHPYDPAETITELPMYTRPTLNGAGRQGEAGTWLGDLQTGSTVQLLTFTPDQIACLVEGETIQGWAAKGWVACNRLDAVGE